MSARDIPPEYPEKYYAQLLFFAHGDLEWAKSKLERTTHYYHKPCFEAREAVEKTLKAFLETSGRSAPDLHSLRTLADLCAQVDKDFLRLRPKCLILQPYQHEARYPELPSYDFTRRMADEAVAIASEVFGTVEAKIRLIEAREQRSR